MVEDEQNLLNADLAPKKEAPSEASVEVAPEKTETVVEAEPSQSEAEPEAQAEAQPQEISEAPTAAPVVQAAPVEKDALTKDIEDVLAEDLTDLFLKLPEDKKTAFSKFCSSSTMGAL